MPHASEQHAQHDPLLVVSLAAGDLTGTDRDRAAALIAACADCALLHDDLLAIARATAALPTAVRPRDFQLTPEQAARLRPRRLAAVRRRLCLAPPGDDAAARRRADDARPCRAAGQHRPIDDLGWAVPAAGAPAARGPAGADVDRRARRGPAAGGVRRLCRAAPAAAAASGGTRIAARRVVRGRGLGLRRRRHRPPGRDLSASASIATSASDGEGQSACRAGAAGVHAPGRPPLTSSATS